MVWKCRLTKFVSAAVVVLTVGCNPPLSSDSGTTEDTPTPPELVQPSAPLRLNPHREYRGKVVDVGLNYMELGLGWSTTEQQKADDVKKPRRFLGAGVHLNGDLRELGPYYRISDLKVGDMVYMISGITRAGEEYCLELTITRRPGGKIPPPPGDLWPDSKLHLRFQAEQDWEEKGIPIPNKYLAWGRSTPWTNPPYPPVAPQPREVAR